jgi:hypothetical protein
VSAASGAKQHATVASHRWDHAALTVCTAIVAAYAVFAYAILDTGSFPTIDAVVKTLQARALLSSHFTSQVLPYPGRSIDPNDSFFPMSPPHVFHTEAGWQGIFPTGVALVNAPLLLFGLEGITLGSLAASFAVLIVCVRLTRVEPRWGLAALLGLGTFLWGYAVLPWEHMPALALSTAAFLCLQHTSFRGAILSGALLGGAACLRDESLMLLPGLMFVCWRRSRDYRLLLLIIAGVIVCPSVVALLDATVYQRPVAAHLRHAVPFGEQWMPVSQHAPGLPLLTRMSWERRYDIVIHEWILGIRGGHIFPILTATFALLAVLRRTAFAAIGTSILVSMLLALHVAELLSLFHAPEVIAGILRWSPILVFALLPSARDSRPAPGRSEALVTMGCFTVGALATVSTHGGFQLGPRLMLPVLPFAAIAAWEGWMSYRVAAPRTAQARFIWFGGCALLAGSICMQVVNQSAFLEFNKREQGEADWLQASATGAVVIDDSETVCVPGPVMDSVPVFLATSQDRATTLARMLANAQVESLVFVSRERPPQDMSFDPYVRKARLRTKTTLLQEWVLPDVDR